MRCMRAGFCEGGSCLSCWERWLSEAKTERVDAARPSQPPAATALPEGEPSSPLSRLRRQLSQMESQGLLSN